MYNLNSPNLIALAVNISRAYEIAKAGNHTVKIVASEKCCIQDIHLLNEFYGFEAHSNPDIIIELANSNHDILNCFKANGCETLADIHKRIKSLNTPVSDTIDTASFNLLKVAIDRLELGVNDVIIIHKLAKTIAKLSDSQKIKVEHIAEAIQYRSYKAN